MQRTFLHFAALSVRRQIPPMQLHGMGPNGMFGMVTALVVEE
jgi:hypothetical protein